MGEYVRFKGKDVHIGTCESLYYITYESYMKFLENGRLIVENRRKYTKDSRFRFPFPDENHDKVGEYENYDRGVTIEVPRTTGIEIAHGAMFFRSENSPKNIDAPSCGIRVPCVQSDAYENTACIQKCDYNHISDKLYLQVVMQKLVDGELQTVVRCPYCGTLCRLSKEEAKALLTHVFKYRKKYGDFLLRIAVIAYKGYVRI